MANKSRSVFECVYCGEVKPVTDEHVPASCIYVRPRPSTLPTVKACAACNGGGSKDDEYFRDCILKYHRVAEQPHVQPLVDAMFRSLAKPAKRRYASATFKALEDVNLVTPAGLHLGKAPVVRVDANRLARTATRYVRGLHRYELGVRVPDTWSVVAGVNPDLIHQKLEQYLPYFQDSPVRVVQDRVFFYTFVRAADRPEATIWLLSFYDQFPILGFVRPPDSALSPVA